MNVEIATNGFARLLLVDLRSAGLSFFSSGREGMEALLMEESDGSSYDWWMEAT